MRNIFNPPPLDPIFDGQSFSFIFLKISQIQLEYVSLNRSLSFMGVSVNHVLKGKTRAKTPWIALKYTWFPQKNNNSRNNRLAVFVSQKRVQITETIALSPTRACASRFAASPPGGGARFLLPCFLHTCRLTKPALCAFYIRWPLCFLHKNISVFLL